MMLIEELSNIPGVSGNESAVRSFIKKSLPQKDFVINTDAMGNLIVYKKGREYPGMPCIMLAAHMDEVGLMISSIENSGHLRFKKVGSIDERILVAKSVLIGNEKIPGIIGSKAIHLQKPDERKKPFEKDNLFIDIGAKDKKETAKMVRIGDYVSFNTTFKPIGEDCFMGKAFDDRAGCAVLIELLKTKGLPSFYAVFTVQEEVGLRGAKIAAYSVNPDIALVIEGTSASDVPFKKDHEHATSLGKGPAISFMDQSVIVDRFLLNKLIKLAQDNKIPYQLRSFTGGGTDAGMISVSRKGVKAAVISVPCRYIHSPNSIIKKDDFRNTEKLARLFLESFKA